jgi:hypothetical protein
MSPSCYLSIGGIGDSNGNIDASTSGDLTAAVTAIIPMPEHLRHQDTPRGGLALSALVLISELCNLLVSIVSHTIHCSYLLMINRLPKVVGWYRTVAFRSVSWH